MKKYFGLLIAIACTASLLNCRIGNFFAADSGDKVIIENQEDENITYSLVEKGYKVTLPKDWTVALEQRGGWEVVNSAKAAPDELEIIMGITKDPKKIENGLGLVAIRFAQDHEVLQINTRDVSTEPKTLARDLLAYLHKSQEDAGMIIDEEKVIEVNGLEAIKMHAHTKDKALFQLLVLGDKTQYVANLVIPLKSLSLSSYYEEILTSFQIVD